MRRNAWHHRPVQTTWPADVRTLAVDIGGSGFKATVLDADGEMLAERVRIETPYPCPPERFVSALSELVSPMIGSAHRASVGFPGMLRHGQVLNVPSLSRAEYGGETDPGLKAAWTGFAITDALTTAFGIPTKVINDADMQGCAVASGEGFEFVMTLGTGVGTALFSDGHLLPHMELSHGPFRDGESSDILLGNASRKRLGNEKWAKLVRKAIAGFDAMLYFDRLYVGGGNAKHLSPQDVGPKGTIVPNTAGLLGGVRVWALDA